MGTSKHKPTISSIWPWDSVLISLGLIVLFGLIYSQAPLYTSNQNQYFLHGAAAAGVGTLENDWLANTVDPTPVFSKLVELTFLLRVPFLFHLYYVLLLGLYLYSVWGILLTTLQPAWTRLQQWIMIVLLVTIHSFALRFSLARLFGQEWRFIFEGGFAGQRLLGTVFQPSTFGVLLLFGILLYLRGRTGLGIASVVLAATFHPTYLLSAALVIAGFMLDTLLDRKNVQQVVIIGALALVLVSPIAWYTWSQFQPTSSRLTEIASQILVEERIPNHILLEEWLDLTVLSQSVLILIAIAGFRRKPVAKIMAVIAAGVFMGTLFQIETSNQHLALLFPWRPSAILVPLSSVLLLGIVADKAINAEIFPLEKYSRQVIGLSSALLLVLAAMGIGSYLHDLRGKQLDTARPMFDFIRSYHAQGDRFFTPPKQQDFRLATGAPILVDFKSIPYVDTEVIEWYERLRTAQNFYRDRVKQINCDQIDQAVALGGINHVVLEPDQLGLVCPKFSELIFSDSSYQVYTLNTEQ
ncbi:MAG: hypothetical protein PVH60_01005 [Anaerolineales bacterium]|jgi:hypothetical protein